MYLLKIAYELCDAFGASNVHMEDTVMLFKSRCGESGKPRLFVHKKGARWSFVVCERCGDGLCLFRVWPRKPQSANSWSTLIVTRSFFLMFDRMNWTVALPPSRHTTRISRMTPWAAVPLKGIVISWTVASRCLGPM